MGCGLHNWKDQNVNFERIWNNRFCKHCKGQMHFQSEWCNYSPKCNKTRSDGPDIDIDSIRRIVKNEDNLKTLQIFEYIDSRRCWIFVSQKFTRVRTIIIMNPSRFWVKKLLFFFKKRREIRTYLWNSMKNF